METAQALSRIAVALESLDSKFMFVPVWLGIWIVVGALKPPAGIAHWAS